MKRRLLCLLSLFFLFSAIPVMAEHVLVIELQNGTTQSFVLSKKPVITFNGSKLYVNSQDASFDEERSNVKDFHFVLFDAIEDVTENEMRFVRLGTNVQIQGLKEGDKPIRVFDMAGRATSALITTNGSQAEVILEGLPKGIYIINIGNKQSIKVTR